MSVLLVAYDVNDPGNSDDQRAEILEAIREYDNISLSESSYALVTELSPDQIHEICFDKMIDKTDKLFVITLSRPYIGSEGPETKWLETHLQKLGLWDSFK